MKQVCRGIIIAIVLTIMSQICATVYYITPNGNNENSGTSWGEAYKTVSYALEQTLPDDEIWMQSGTYSEPEEQIYISPFVSIYGEFNGTESTLEEREFHNTRTEIIFPEIHYAGISSLGTLDHIYSTDLEIENHGLIINCEFMNTGINNYQKITNTVLKNSGIGNNPGIITNCTIYSAKGQRIDNAKGAITNSIIWGYSSQYTVITNTGIISNSCYPDGSGNGNLSENPQFISTNGSPENWDLHLKENSPCINHGIFNKHTEEQDIEGIARTEEDGLDIGAYERGTELKANFYYDIAPQNTTGKTVYFFDYSTGEPEEWKWDFNNDGTIDSTVKTPSHHFSTDGIKKITLTISENNIERSISKEFNLDFGTIYYVSKNEIEESQQDGLSWETAFNSILAAKESCSDNDCIWVSEGIYQDAQTLYIPEGISVYGGFTGSETKVRERNLASHPTVLDRQKNGLCVSNSGILDGFHLTNGTGLNSSRSGLANNGITRNCKIYGNGKELGRLYPQCTVSNGYEGLLSNCCIYANTSTNVCVRSNGQLENCTIAKNTSPLAASVFYGQTINCIITNDTGYALSSNHFVSNSCFKEALGERNNISDAPEFLNTEGDYTTWDFHLKPGSPGIDAGAYLSGYHTDIEGTSRPQGNGFDMGAYEYSRELNALYIIKNQTKTTNEMQVSFKDHSTGNPTQWAWDFNGDSIIDSTEQDPAYTYTENGRYIITLTVQENEKTDSYSRELEITGLNIPVYYISENGSDENNGESWETAYKTLAFALAQHPEDSKFWVKYGTYREAGLLISDSISIYGGFAGTETSLSERNMNEFTTIIDGDNQTEAFLNKGVIDGFTILNRKAGAHNGGIENSGILKNTTIEQCSGFNALGAVNNKGAGLIDSCIFSENQDLCLSNYSGTVTNCLFDNNQCSPTANLILNIGLLNRCIIRNHSSIESGLTLTSNHGILENCLIYNNDATAITNENGLLRNNTITSNSGYGINNQNGSIYNSIIANNGHTDINFSDNNYGGQVYYNCYQTSNLTMNESNIQTEPLFVNTAGDSTSFDFHLQSNSPCIDTGTDLQNPLSDLEGVKRPQGQGTDIGAYEYNQFQADILADQSGGLVPLTVSFSDASYGSPTAWQWDFDNDGTIDSTEQNPEYTYTMPGFYTVKLSATNTEGVNREIIKENFIAVAPEDTAPFDATFSSSTIPDTLDINASYTLSVSFQNTGYQTWEKNSEIKLGSMESSSIYTPYLRYYPAANIKYGDIAEFNITLITDEPGTYQTSWQMVKEGAFWFGDILEKNISVGQETIVQTPVWSLY